MAVKKKVAVEEVYENASNDIESASDSLEGYEVPSNDLDGEEIIAAEEVEEDDAGTSNSVVPSTQIKSSTLVLSNPTNNARGLMLKGKVLLLYPGETKVVPDKDTEEVLALLKTNAVQMQIEAGLLRVSKFTGDELIDQPTIDPPAELSSSVQVGDTALSVGTRAQMTAAGSMKL